MRQRHRVLLAVRFKRGPVAGVVLAGAALIVVSRLPERANGEIGVRRSAGQVSSDPAPPRALPPKTTLRRALHTLASTTRPKEDNGTVYSATPVPADPVQPWNGPRPRRLADVPPNDHLKALLDGYVQPQREGTDWKLGALHDLEGCAGKLGHGEIDLTLKVRIAEDGSAVPSPDITLDQSSLPTEEDDRAFVDCLRPLFVGHKWHLDVGQLNDERTFYFPISFVLPLKDNRIYAALMGEERNHP